MKRIFLLLLGLMPILAFSQVRILQKTDVLSDEIKNDGSRVIVSQYYSVFSALVTASTFTLDCITTKATQPQYFLHLYLNMGDILVEGGKALLLKLDNNEVIELKSLEESKYEISDSNRRIVDASYPIEESMLKKIMERSIVKIRIEYNGGYFDRQFKKNKFGDNLKIAYNNIQLALQKESKSIRDDF